MKNITRITLAFGLVTVLSAGAVKATASESGHWEYDINGKQFVVNGQTLSGWQVISGRWSYLNPNKGNYLATSETIDGKYYVDKNGEWNDGRGKVTSEKDYFPTEEATYTPTAFAKGHWEQNSGGKWFFYFPDGTYAMDTIIDGKYRVAWTGVWDNVTLDTGAQSQQNTTSTYNTTETPKFYIDIDDSRCPIIYTPKTYTFMNFRGDFVTTNNPEKAEGEILVGANAGKMLRQDVATGKYTLITSDTARQTDKNENSNEENDKYQNTDSNKNKINDNRISEDNKNMDSKATANNLGNQVADTNCYGGHSINEVINKWTTLKPTFRGNIFDVEPNIKAPYNQGKVNSSYLNDTLNYLNFARYLAKLEPVQLDSNLTNKAQYGALITTVNDELKHTNIKHPSDMSDDIYEQGEEATSTSNLCGGKVFGSILECLNDNNNLMGNDNIGHREWLLDPEVTRIGFGTTSKYSAQCLPFDNFDTNVNKPDYLAWPSEGAFPNSFIRRQAVWSIGLNKDVYNISNNVQIKVTRLYDGKVWKLSNVNSFSSNTTGFKVLSNNEYGFGRNYDTIIFHIGSNDLSAEKYLGNYKIEILGLNKNLEYTTNFFDLNN